MPKSCCVFECSNNKTKNPDLKYYILPHDPERRKLWLNAISRTALDKDGNILKNKLWSPRSKYHYVCSKHFISGKKKNQLNDPDYVPSVFSYKSCGKKHQALHRQSVLNCNKISAAYASDKSQPDLLSSQIENIDKIMHSNITDKAGCSTMIEQNFLPLASPTSPTIAMKSLINICERESMFHELDNMQSEKSSQNKNIKEIVHNDMTNKVGCSTMIEQNYLPLASPTSPTTAMKSLISICERESMYHEIDNMQSERSSQIENIEEIVHNNMTNEVGCCTMIEQNYLPLASPTSPTITMKSLVSEYERESIYHEMDYLRSERDILREKLLLPVHLSPYSFQVLRENPDTCLMLTGLKFDILTTLIDYLFIGEHNGDHRPTRYIMEDQIILTIVKLKHNMSFDMLAHLCSISKTTAIEYFWKWIDVMSEKLKFLIRMEAREHIFETIPHIFKSKFPRLTSIIDCFEVFIESPGPLLARAQCYSSYKKHCTLKVFISCTPLGAINFLSKCWGGRVSDIQIVKESNFTSSKYHYPGDQILADPGFTLKDDFAAHSSSELLVPAFAKNKCQLSVEEVESTRNIASVRIHIERIIGLMKNRYKILKGILPIRSVKSLKDEANHLMYASCDKVVLVCAALTNLGESIVFR
ncbi:uncharacterized protein LOC124813596 [Hydra vulgaris]|uniref:uncharacterized protein LOC124813596 n=1 Tax=Hydra vulgaris TaxID=6087 RepID=UPI001F5EC18D|nr:uncharacterized protein LOC124813596 [Hydra vulgaris]